MLIRTFTEFGRPYPWLCTVVCIMILLAPIEEGVDVTYYQTVNITKVQSAVKNRAVCLDGSPPAYHHATGVGEGASNWLVFLEGGGWCDSTESCLNRTQNIYGLGSSNIMLAKNFTGILTNQKQLNPYFYNWNRVFVRYCDGASFTGNNIDHVTKLHYKGAKIFNAIVKDLLAKGMSNATNALIAGCSSGGLSAMLNCDKFRTLLPAKINVKCASDAGFFLHVKDVFGGYSFAEFFHNIVTLHGSTKNLPKACTSKMKPKSLCFYPQYAVPHIKTPLFLINSAYDTYQTGYILAPSSPKLPVSWERCKNDTQTCSLHQLQTLKGFRSTFLSALPETGNGSFRGMFISSCLAHCQSQLQINWDWDPGFRLENKAMADALGEWFYGKSTSQRIDYDDELPKICLSK